MNLNIEKYKQQYVDIEHPLYGPVMVYINTDIDSNAKYYTKIEIVGKEEDVTIARYRHGAYHESMMAYYDQVIEQTETTDKDIRYVWLVFNVLDKRWNVGHIDYTYEGARND